MFTGSVSILNSNLTPHPFDKDLFPFQPQCGKSVGVWRRGSDASGRRFTVHGSAKISVFRALVLTAASEVVRAVTAAVPKPAVQFSSLFKRPSKYRVDHSPFNLNNPFKR